MAKMIPAQYASSFSFLLLFFLLQACWLASAAAPSPSYRFVIHNGSQSKYQISPKAIVSDACASFSTLEALNNRVKPAVEDLTSTTDFFSHYRLNLFHKSCPFWNDENGMCGNIACAVQTLDSEDDIPEVWRAEELGKLEGPTVKHPGKDIQKKRPERPLQGKLGEDVGESCVIEYDDECDDRDYCVPEDESVTSKGDYVSLLQNPERFTGYAGEGAQQVWNAIYRENCFQKSSFPHHANLGQSTSAKGPAALDFKNVIEAAGRQQLLEQSREQSPNTPFVAHTGLEAEDECIEKRVFYRVVSGMHTSISTHLCYDWMNQTTGEWQPNLSCYMDRLHTHPERISNLYFNYALLTRAVTKLGPHLQDYTFCTGDRDQDSATKAKVLAVTQGAASVPQIFDESLMFTNGEGPSLKEDFKNRFRNVSRLMDCVGCDKCRLWGKLQTAGYGTALKVLFEFDNDSDEIPVLKRTELVALFNTYARLSTSMDAIQKFRAMVAEKEREEEELKMIEQRDGEGSTIPDRAKKPRHVVPAKQEEAGEMPPLKEVFDSELDNVLNALRGVWNAWMSLPGLTYTLVSQELKRIWQGYIGLPVQPRQWKLVWRNTHDEL